MTTITLKYNPRNTIAKKTLDYIVSLGVFEVQKPKKTGIEKGLDDIKNGRVTKVKSVTDYFKNV